MFSTIFDAMQGLHQAAFLLGATLMLGVAGAILADFFHRRITAREYDGEIVALRAKRSRRTKKAKREQRVFYPVIEYVTPDGRRLRAHTRSGSSSVSNKLPGRRVRILVTPGEEDVARVKSLGHALFGLVFAAFGLVLATIALTQYRFSFWTIPCFLAIAGFVVTKLYFPSRSQAATEHGRFDTVKAWRQRKLQEMLEECEEVGPDEIRQLARDQDRVTRKATPVFALAALGLLAFGQFLGQDVLSLETTGLSAPGEISRIESRQSQDSDGGTTTMYYPVVEFRTEGGRSIEFTSRFGSSSTSYRRGDLVTVLYSPVDPREDVMIDRGAWNWALPGGLVGVGLIVLLASTRSFIAATRRARTASDSASVGAPDSQQMAQPL